MKNNLLKNTFRFLKLHQLQDHEHVTLLKHGPFECSKCKLNTGLDSRIEYLKHLLLCYFPDLYTCKTCSNSYDNYVQYLFHIRYIHTHVVYMCAICSRKYRNIKDLLDHDQLMHSKTVNYCEICFEPHKSRCDLYEHYRKSHLNESSRVFNEDFSASAIIGEEHLNSLNDSLSPEFFNDTPHSLHLNQNQNRLPHALFIETEKNEDCSKTVKKPVLKSNMNKTTLKVHDKHHNTDVEQVEWKKARVHKNDLVRGLIDRKHQCKWCSLRFYTKTQLKQHEATHINSTLYCPVCDKEFTHKDRLAGHMKCHMEPSLECKVCGKKFKRLCNLYNHELVHGLTEHAFMLCQFCGRGFRSRRDYQNHVIANHRDQLMKADAGSNHIWPKTNSTSSTGAPTASMSINTTTESTKKANLKSKVSKQPNNRKLSNEQSQFGNNSQPVQEIAKNMSILEIEPDTYFTRTDTIQFSRDALDDVDLGDVNMEEDDVFNELEESSSLENEFNAEKMTSNRTKQKGRDLIRNKFKRLKTSLNIEVVDDDDDDRHTNQLEDNPQHLNVFSHILSQNGVNSTQTNEHHLT